MNRKGLEFRAAVKLQMFRRAGGPEALRCEGCQRLLMGKPFDYHHVVAVWEMPDDMRREFRKTGVPAEYGKVLGHCCHAPETKKGAAARAKCNKVAKSVAKVKKAKQHFRGWRKFNGDVVWND